MGDILRILMGHCEKVERRAQGFVLEPAPGHFRVTLIGTSTRPQRGSLLACPNAALAASKAPPSSQVGNHITAHTATEAPWGRCRRVRHPQARRPHSLLP